MLKVKEFFRFARERESIRIAREEGQPFPWTRDRVLGLYRFCNVFREDDRTTVWFRENIREPLRNDPEKVVLATAGFRWFNRVEVGELIQDILVTEGWNSAKILKRLKGVKPIVTGAYMIKTPTGMNKLDGIVNCMEELKLMPHIFNFMKNHMTKDCSLEMAWAVLKQAPFLGEFMAYEIITDLRHTCVLENASDIMTWANPGPGAARGLSWVTSDGEHVYNRHSAKDRPVLMYGMREILEVSVNPKYWPSEWRLWELREVEHTLCEFDKFKRGHEGQSLKRKFKCTS